MKIRISAKHSLEHATPSHADESSDPAFLLIAGGQVFNKGDEAEVKIVTRFSGDLLKQWSERVTFMDHVSKGNIGDMFECFYFRESDIQGSELEVKCEIDLGTGFEEQDEPVGVQEIEATDPEPGRPYISGAYAQFVHSSGKAAAVFGLLVLTPAWNGLVRTQR